MLFMRDNELTEHFDPLGKVPDQHFKDYMSFQSQNYMYNTKRCQHYLRARDYSMQDILDMFVKNDLVYNDQLVYFFYAYTK